MSRVFSAMTGTGSPRPVAAVEGRAGPDEAYVVEADGSPFVEIGGPTGPIFSVPSPKPASEAKTRPEPAPARAYPRIAAPVPPPADATPYLSVRFHDTTPRSPGRPAAGPDHGLVALHHPDHPVSGEYRTLRDAIAGQLPDAPGRVLAFTAAVPEAGTTTVILNLGITLALAGQRVLVADTNFTRPGVAAKLGLPAAPGLAEVLGEQLPLPWALQPTAVPSLQALTAGARPESAGAQALGSAIGRDLPKLLGQLQQWFDWILVDAGVWGVVPERDATCPAARAVYLVTREADVERTEFTGLRAWVTQLGGALRGYVATRV